MGELGLTFHFAHGEDADGLDGGQCPCGQVEVLRDGFDGFMAPFQSGGEEPRDRQHHPPDGRRHTEEVQHHEQDGAQLVLGALPDR